MSGKTIRDILEEHRPPMFPHQAKAVETATTSDYAFIIRGAGSGKTRIGVEILERNLSSNALALWVCPAALVEQAIQDFIDNGLKASAYIQNEDFPRGEVIVVSYDMLKNRVKEFTSVRWDVVIADEFHRTRTKGTIINEGIWYVRQKAKKFYTLTATPFNNREEELYELISLTLGKDMVNKLKSSIKTVDKKPFFLYSLFKRLTTGEFAKSKTKSHVIFNKRKINKIIDQFVDYIPQEEYMGFLKRPTPVSEIKKVEMSNEEIKEYINIRRSDSIPNKEIAYRTLLLGEGSTKIKQAVKDIKNIFSNSEARVLIFSNFVKSGISVLKSSLKAEGLSSEVFKGGMSGKEREEMGRRFQEGNIKILILSPAGFEGLNLKGATHILVLDPHYNPAKTEQLVARGLRAGTDIEKVYITHYCSVSSKRKLTTIDEKIFKTSKDKSKKNEALEDLIKRTKEKGK
jgi:superfamily II DNA or RNA helicase